MFCTIFMLMALNCTRLAPLPNSMFCVIDCLFVWMILKAGQSKTNLNSMRTRRGQWCWGSRQFCLESREIPLFLQAVWFPLHLWWRALVSPLTLPCPWNSRSTLCVGLSTPTSDRYLKLECFWAWSQLLKLFLALFSAALIIVILCSQILPLKVSRSFKMFKKCAARLVLAIRKREHITPALKNLHWLPISQRIHYKLSLLCYKSFSSLFPSYLSDPLSPYTVSRILRSTSDITRLSVPRYRFEQYGKRAFSRSAPSVWNSLPAVLRETNTTNSFKTHLKTHLFRCI